MMSEKKLQAIRRLKAELEAIESELADKEVFDTVQSAAKFPYSLHSVPVVGLPASEEVWQLQLRKEELKEQIADILKFINSAPEEMRFILREKYIFGRSNLNIALRLGYRDEGTVRKKLKNFFAVSDFSDSSGL